MGKLRRSRNCWCKKTHPSSLLVRTSAFFGPWDEYNFVHYVQKSLSQYETITVAKDVHVSPTYVPHLVNTVLDLLIDRESGIWHLSNKGSLTWSEFAHRVADRFALDRALIQSVNVSQLNYPARRPFYTVLGSERGQLLPSFDVAMEEYCHATKREKSRQVA